MSGTLGTAVAALRRGRRCQVFVAIAVGILATAVTAMHSLGLGNLPNSGLSPAASSSVVVAHGIHHDSPPTSVSAAAPSVTVDQVGQCGSACIEGRRASHVAHWVCLAVLPGLLLLLSWLRRRAQYARLQPGEASPARAAWGARRASRSHLDPSLSKLCILRI